MQMYDEERKCAHAYLLEKKLSEKIANRYAANNGKVPTVIDKIKSLSPALILNCWREGHKTVGLLVTTTFMESAFSVMMT